MGVTANYTRYSTKCQPDQLSFHSAPPSHLYFAMESTYPNPRPQHPSLPSAPPHHPSLRMAVTQPTPSSSHTSQDGQPAGRPQTLHHSEHGHLVLSGPMYHLPSMDGWWKCCQDEFENNPAFGAEFCGQCRHRKCYDCKKCSNQGFHTAAVSHRFSPNCRPTYPPLNPNQAVHGYVSTRTSTHRYTYRTTTTRDDNTVRQER